MFEVGAWPQLHSWASRGTGDQADGRPITSMWGQKAEAGNEKRSGKASQEELKGARNQVAVVFN